MKTFKQFLDTSKFDLEKFKTDCAPVLSMLKGTHGKLLPHHGTKNFPTDYVVRAWRERSGPRDSPDDLHDALNIEFKKMFGAPIRNWLFVTGDYGTALAYSGGSSPCVVFPKGNFEWVCCTDENLFDLTTHFDKIRSSLPLDADLGIKAYASQRAKAIEQTVDDLHTHRWLHNENFTECLRSKNEVLIKCDDFYLFNKDGTSFYQVEQFLKSW